MENSDQRLKTKQYWQTKIREAENFSGSETEFCRQEGLNNTTFKNWKYRLSMGSKRGSVGRRKPVRLCFCSSENSETKSGSFAP
ncbi:MAG: hypothetical protein IPK68_04795 [Bdellovibrionales bacterium]|nr:hypothetical protein [Bdellovibrionales bacterium]